ncbi:MAG: GNAT family N-acetyltransferase [bacterium]|nr:GNAT family N-acetyltransferase [bacterium]
MNIIIRPAIPGDFSIIQRLNHALFIEESERGHDARLNLDYPLSVDGEEYYKRALCDPKKAVFLAEDDQGNFAGYIIGSNYNKFPYRTAIADELENMYIVPEARRQGVGARLVQAFRTWLKERGAERMYVSAYAKNSSAIAFYTSLGFAPWEIGFEMEV